MFFLSPASGLLSPLCNIEYPVSSIEHRVSIMLSSINKSNHPVQIEIFRNMPPLEKLYLAARLFEDAKQIKKAALHDRHPSWNEEQLEQAVVKLFIYGKYKPV
jgi:hypothetical protein